MSHLTFDNSLPIAIGADHAGFEYKEDIKKMLVNAGWKIEDKGTYSLDSVDYPDFAHPAAEMVESGAATAGMLDSITIAPGGPIQQMWDEEDTWYTNNALTDKVVLGAGLTELAALTGVNRTMLAALETGGRRIGRPL